MRIEICEYGVPCGDSRYFCRYDSESCPHGSCEVPNVVMISKPKPEPEKEIIIIPKPRTGKKSGPPGIDWDRVKPIIVRMHEVGLDWVVIARAIGVSPGYLSKYRRKHNFLYTPAEVI